jgi:hypothetical protein
MNGSPASNLVAERIRRALIVAGVSVESCSSIRAAAPDTAAADMLVPERMR